MTGHYELIVQHKGWYSLLV